MSPSYKHAREAFRFHGGTLRTADALAAGIHPRTLYAMRDSGEIELLARGVFRLSELPPLSNPDLATVAKAIPQGVVCLVSALAFHELTTQVPHAVQLALPRTARRPRLAYPPIQLHWFSPASYASGVETRLIDHIPVRVYSVEKTLADCFKYRNRVGMEVVLEALRSYRTQRKPRLDKVLEFARICRVERLMRPYLEALV